MAFNPRTITKELDFANLAKHNDNYADIKTELDAHNAHIAAQTAHGSTADATPGAIMQRDSAGRAKVAAPAAADDIARKAEVDAVQEALDDHIDDADVHLSEADRDKLDGIEAGAEPNQNAFAQVNNVVAASESDTLTIAGGTGIAISTNPTTKTVTVTATGEATPGPHGSSHNNDGSDPIPELVALRNEFDALTPASIGAETPAGAQAKVDALAGEGNTKTVAEVAEDVADVTAQLADVTNKFPKLGFWEDIEPGANIWRFGDRVFVGDAVDQNGYKTPLVRSWVGESANGYMTYFDSRSEVEVINKIGGIGVASASRSSDNDRLQEENTMGFASYVDNDNSIASDKKSVWSYYGHAVQSKPNKFTTALELDVCDISGSPLTEVNPYITGADGTTATAWFGVGGETVQSGIPATAYVSCALGIITSVPDDPYSKYDKGIVFSSKAIAGTDGYTGTGIAMEMAKGHELVWRFSGGPNAYGGKIRSDCNSATGQQRIVFENNALAVKGVKNDYVTEINLFKVLTDNEAANYLLISPSSAGNGASLLVDGTDANIDIRLQPKGSGVLDYSKAATAAATPLNFTATHYLPIKANGVIYYMPVRSSAW